MKKFLFFLIGIALIVPVFASAEGQQDISGEMLKSLGILKGYDDGSLKLEQQITRAEYSTLIIRMLGYEEDPIEIDKNQVFMDFNKEYWAYNNIMTAYKMGLIQGYSDKTFKPQKNVSKAEAIAMVVRMLGYNDDAKGDWPNNYLNLADNLGILKNVDISNPNDPITRGEVAIIFDNSLPINIK